MCQFWDAVSRNLFREFPPGILPILSSSTRSTCTSSLLSRLFFCFLFSVILLFLTLAFYIEPFHRGFFCDDESLMHPYHESTVGLSLAIVGFGLPILLIILMEFASSKFNEGDCASVKLFNRDIPFWALGVYKNVVVFLFGAYVNILITDIGKRVVGRLRPHFLEVCQPIMPGGTNCSDSRNLHRYIEEFTCGNNLSSATQLKEIRLSFPSGHSSLSMYTMIFAVFYLHFRMKWQGSRLLKHFIQSALFAMAWFTALSRISDYKHHCKKNISFCIVNFTTSLFQGLMLLADRSSE